MNIPYTPPPVQPVGPDICVAPQLDVIDMNWVAQNGFRSVINNRPDFEEGDHQPTNAAIQAQAVALGLQYAFLPVEPGYQSPEQIARFAELIEQLPKPILAFCRSGTRSGKLYRAAVGG
ncbi:MAG: TIGR01244 family sulfur transferase [Burkholderiales bacterium]